MPQLNPAPWFAIMMFSWLVFLIVLPPKIMAHLFPNEATSQSAQTPKTKTWTWPWP
uniref:ATP synthase complex subunit 8 n=1 Tax=Lagocephalus inermis TaxID=229056 RepID=E2GMY2_9TELE|nr:ATPase subunit 8 [Lagocephalus inermis]ADN96610.1 ATP synthase F0 subunit 8 [Lagocephalus inermis]AMA21300.1 ATPase subunit 8 [Lagocephalus inermis]